MELIKVNLLHKIRFRLLFVHQCRQSLNTLKTEYIFVNGVSGFVTKKEKSGV